MSTRGKIAFDAIVFVVFWLALSFRMAIEVFPLKLLAAVCGAWLIARAYHWIKGA